MANKPSMPLPVITLDEAINYILCPVCGNPFKPNDQNLCLRCLSEEIDITSDILKKNPKLSIKHCNSCKRWYNNKNAQWKVTEIGSPDLIDILVRKLEGLHKKEHKILKSSFIEHTKDKQIILDIHLQKDIIFDNKETLKLDKVFSIEFSIIDTVCKDCKISDEYLNTWKSCVQIRQNNVNHYRLLYFLEQLLLKHHNQSFVNCLKIEQSKTGLDFYFEKESHSRMFIQHLTDIICIKSNVKKQQALNSKNCGKNNIQKFKTSYFVELPSLCANDLCLIPEKLQKKCGGNSPLVLVERVASSLHFMEPSSGHTISLDSKLYFRFGFGSVASLEKLSVFYVISVSGIRVNNVQLWEVELVRESELGMDDENVLESVTNLEWLKDGDMVEGYDIGKLSNSIEGRMKKFGRKHKICDVIIVQRYNELKRERDRKWKLKRFERVTTGENYKMERYLTEKRQRDWDMFLNQIRLHKPLRAQINVWKNDEYIKGCKEEKEDDGYGELEEIADSELMSNAVRVKDVEMDNDND